MCGNRANLQGVRTSMRKINLKLNITKNNNVLQGVSHLHNQRLLFQLTKEESDGPRLQIETIEESGNPPGLQKG